MVEPFETAKFRHRISGEVWMFCLTEGCHNPWFRNYYEDHKTKFHGPSPPPEAECRALQDLSQFELISDIPTNASNDDKEVLNESDQNHNNTYAERKTSSDEKVELDKAEPRSVRFSTPGRRQEEERMRFSEMMYAGRDKEEVQLNSFLTSGNSGDRRNYEESESGDFGDEVGRRWVQKLVMVHPAGVMTDTRKSDLEQSGMPQCRGSHSLKRMDISHHYGVPSDMHMFWEESRAGEAGNVSSLSVALIGNANTPDLSEYADTVKRVVFFGHICRIKTALQMVMQLKACEKVEFRLGSKEQSEFYLEDDLLPASLEGGWSIYDETHPLIEALSIKSNVSQNDDGSEKAAIKMIVRKQLRDILSFGHILWPNVNKMVVDLPGEGIYLDIVRQYLPLWSKVHETFHVELKDSKICLGRINPTNVSTAEEFELSIRKRNREDVSFGKEKDNRLEGGRIDQSFMNVVNQESTGMTVMNRNDSTLQQNVLVNAAEPESPEELLSDMNFGVTSSYRPQLLDESTLYTTRFYLPQQPLPSNSQSSTDDFNTGAIVEDDEPVAIVKRDEGFKVSIGLGLEDLRSHIQNKQKLAESQPQSSYSGYIYDATSDSYRRAPSASFSETQRCGTAISDHSRFHFEADNNSQVPFPGASGYSFDSRNSYLSTYVPGPSLLPTPNAVNPPSTYNWSFIGGNYTQPAPACYDSQSSRTQENKIFAQTWYRPNEAAGVEGVPFSPQSYVDTTFSPMSSNQAELNPANRGRAPSPWSSSSEEDELMEEGKHNVSLSSRHKTSSSYKRYQKKPDRRSGLWKHKSGVNTSIVIMGVPETYSEYELNGIMKQILPHWIGRPTKERIGSATGFTGRPRPLKIVLRNSKEVDEAIRNSQRCPVKLKDGSNTSVKKYIPKLDRNWVGNSHTRPSHKNSTSRSQNEHGNPYRSVFHSHDRHDSSSDQDMPSYNSQDQK